MSEPSGQSRRKGAMERDLAVDRLQESVSENLSRAGTPERIVSVHFPKAAGTSLRSQFAALVGDALQLDYDHDPLTPSGGELARFPAGKKIVHGHFRAARYAPDSAYLMTFLREPVDNLISIYFYWRSLTTATHELHARFLRDRPSILQFAAYPPIRRLMSETYFGGFDMGRFDFIGFYETRSADVARLASELGLPLTAALRDNVTPEARERDLVSADPETIVRLHEILTDDVAFYWLARRRFAICASRVEDASADYVAAKSLFCANEAVEGSKAKADHNDAELVRGHPNRAAANGDAAALAEALRALEQRDTEKQAQVAQLEATLAEARAAAAGSAERLRRMEADGRRQVDESEPRADDARRRSEDLVRLLAMTKRPDYDGRLPKKLRGLKRWMPGRRRKFRRLAHEYQLIAASALFDADWYLANNPDVVALGISPVYHYLRYGAAEGRAPGPHFDGWSYKAANPDVAASGEDPLLHFIRTGASEGRSPGHGLQMAGAQIALSATSVGAYRGQGHLESGDKYVQLPLPFLTKPVRSSPRVVVLFHCYYTDLLDNYLRYFNNIPVEFDLRISTDTDEKRDNIAAAFANGPQKSIEIAVVTNRGRDVAPRFVHFRTEYSKYDLALHVHTKKSLHNRGLESWPAQLLDDCLGSSKVVSDIFSLFESIGDLGIVASRYNSRIRKFVEWGPNVYWGRALARRLGIIAEADDVIHFPAGSVFWARTDALRPLLDLDLTIDDFEPESGQTDGTLAHAIERLIFASGEIAGYGWCFVGGAPTRDTTGSPFTAGSFAALAGLLRQQRPAIARGSCVNNTSLLKERFRQQAGRRLTAFLKTDRRIALKTVDDPEITVIVVLYNGAELTAECFAALQRAVLASKTEIIVVDNGSTDQTRALLERVDGLRIVLNAENRHFLKAANQAARLAKGRLLLFLNNDVSIPSHSIETAANLLKQYPHYGAVGAKLVLLDGSLQEAGSVIWSDGTCVGYGRGESPTTLLFEFRREVDYCSGAFLMVRNDLFQRLGALDDVFAPAYYEETDLCMRIRAAAFAVVYEPTIEVAHFEFGSSPTTAAALDVLSRNYKVFKERHKGTLAAYHYPQGASVFKARSASPGRRILIIDDRVPYSWLGAGYPRMSDLISELSAKGWLITFYPLLFPRVDVAAARDAFPPGVEFAKSEGEASLGEFLRQRGDSFGAIIVSRPHNMAAFQRVRTAAYARGNEPFVIYDAEAIFTEREALRRELKGKPFSDAQLFDALETEIGITRGADVLIAVSARDKATFDRHSSLKCHVLGHRVLPRPTPTSFDERRDFLFVGALNGDSSTAPNVDALVWFVREVMPRLDKRIGDSYVLRVAGRVESVEVEALAGDRVAILGVVPDLESLHAMSRVFIAPTRFAAGLPFKVQEASSFGTPTVATGLIAAQLGRLDGDSILVGDTPEEFSRACARLYSERALWEGLRQRSLEALGRECAPSAFNDAIEVLLRDIPARDPVLNARKARVSEYSKSPN